MYLSIANNKIVGVNVAGYSELGVEFPIEKIEVSDEIYNAYLEDERKVIYQDGEVVLNPNYEEIKAQERRDVFHREFFNTSLGYIRRKVTMADGSQKDFLSDLLPVISMAVSQTQPVTVLAYNEPDFSQDVEDWTIYQHTEVATTQFIQECFNQVEKDFKGK